LFSSTVKPQPLRERERQKKKKEGKKKKKKRIWPALVLHKCERGAGKGKSEES
jgi:hypothetical protein